MTINVLKPQAAFDFIQKNNPVIFIDIRSSIEFLFVGHALRSVNIPWIDNPNWSINPNFCNDIKQYVQYRYPKINIEQIPIVLICRSGVRSLEAALALQTSGLSSIYYVLEGFEGDLNDDNQRGYMNGWRFHHLPWVQS